MQDLYVKKKGGKKYSSLVVQLCLA